MTRDELIEAGRNIGYAFAIIHTSLRSDEMIHEQVEYVMTKQEADLKAKASTLCFISEIVPLK